MKKKIKTEKMIISGTIEFKNRPTGQHWLAFYYFELKRLEMEMLALAKKKQALEEEKAELEKVLKMGEVVTTWIHAVKKKKP